MRDEGRRNLTIESHLFCRLIRNSNGLTTIQLVKQQQEQYQQELRQREREQETPMEDDVEEEKHNESSSSSSSSNGHHEPEIDVTNVSNSNCDLIRHSEERPVATATDLRKYD